jgi:hypothetical protein
LALARAFNAFGEDGEAAALAQIEATGSRSQKALARLMLAHERRDWESVLNLSRAGTVNASEAKPREIRALGELGRLDEMVQIYGRAGPLLPQARQECALFVLVFTGRVEGVQQLLNGSLSGVDYDSKTYWLAVARLRRDHNDEIARAMLGILRQTATKDRLRRSSVEHLRASEDGSALPPLTEETERAVDAIIRVPLERARTQHERRQRLRQRRKAAAWLLLVCIILAVAEGYCSFRHIVGTR